MDWHKLILEMSLPTKTLYKLTIYFLRDDNIISN